ncbi:uncharacterized protein BJ171DRAFT_518868 [Polychytrium aggregatum]|uniref:uncharacterized protein n=1 Tax=Polychytrium aggregatum TaxID=110093 RepID=UPI0022FE919F|nr:uncharacterized protein BJ171DRAFT_518868 [Polychytrium aggregatum]KAI9199355.1 hypothetical protein BJ171DRAFT_518868 [Polychytrium aggregatum]
MSSLASGFSSIANLKSFTIASAIFGLSLSAVVRISKLIVSEQHPEPYAIPVSFQQYFASYTVADLKAALGSYSQNDVTLYKVLLGINLVYALSLAVASSVIIAKFCKYAKLPGVAQTLNLIPFGSAFFGISETANILLYLAQEDSGKDSFLASAAFASVKRSYAAVVSSVVVGLAATLFVVFWSGSIGRDSRQKIPKANAKAKKTK